MIRMLRCPSGCLQNLNWIDWTHFQVIPRARTMQYPDLTAGDRQRHSVGWKPGPSGPGLWGAGLNGSPTPGRGPVVAADTPARAGQSRAAGQACCNSLRPAPCNGARESATRMIRGRVCPEPQIRTRNGARSVEARPSDESRTLKTHRLRGKRPAAPRSPDFQDLWAASLISRARVLLCSSV